MAANIIAFLIVYVLVPVLLIALMAGSAFYAFRKTDGLSRPAGWFGGIVLFIIYYLYTPNRSVTELPLSQSLDLAIGALFAGLIVGFILIVVIYRMGKFNQIASLVILLLNFAGLSGLFAFYVVRVYNDMFISAISGFLFGVLLYLVFFGDDTYNY